MTMSTETTCSISCRASSTSRSSLSKTIGVEESGGVQPPSQGFGQPGRSSESVVWGLVLELVEGPTLAERLGQVRQAGRVSQVGTSVPPGARL